MGVERRARRSKSPARSPDLESGYHRRAAVSALDAQAVWELVAGERPILWLDSGDRIVDATPALEAVTGSARRDLRGSRLFDLAPIPEHSAIREWLADARRGIGASSHLTLLLPKTKRHKLRCRPIRVGGALWLALEDTLRDAEVPELEHRVDPRALATELGELRAIVDSIPSALFAVRDSGSPTPLNVSALRLLGAEPRLRQHVSESARRPIHPVLSQRTEFEREGGGTLALELAPVPGAPLTVVIATENPGNTGPAASSVAPRQR